MVEHDNLLSESVHTGREEVNDRSLFVHVYSLRVAASQRTGLDSVPQSFRPRGEITVSKPSSLQYVVPYEFTAETIQTAASSICLTGLSSCVAIKTKILFFIKRGRL